MRYHSSTARAPGTPAACLMMHLAAVMVIHTKIAPIESRPMFPLEMDRAIYNHYPFN